MTLATGGKYGTIVFDEPPSADRQHVCKVCSRTFKRSEHRLRHERVHTQEKPFRCRYCPKRYARRDLVARHEKTLHASTSTAVSDPNRNCKKSERAANDSSDAVEQNDAVLVDGEVESPRSGSLTEEHSPELVSTSRNAPAPLFLADMSSSAAIQPPHFALELSTADAASDSLNESHSGIGGSRESIQAHVSSDIPSSLNTRQQEDLPIQGGPPNQHNANIAPLQDLSFANLDFLDTFLGLPYDISDFLGFHEEPAQLGTLSPIPQDGRLPSQNTEYANPHADALGNTAPFNPQFPMPAISFGTPMHQAQSQAHVLPPKEKPVPDCPTLSEPSPSSTSTTASSLPEVIKSSLVKRVSFEITRETRTALYTDLTTRLTQDDLLDSEFPDAPTLEKCLRSYAHAFHVHLPIVHLSSLVVEETPSPLILIMSAIGALYRLERKSGINMYRKALRALTRSVSSWTAMNEPLLAIDELKPLQEATSPSNALPLWIMQTRFLLGVFGTLNGNAGLIKKAFGLLGAQWVVRISFGHVINAEFFAGLSLHVVLPECSPVRQG